MTIITCMVNREKFQTLQKDSGMASLKEGYKTGAAAILEITLLGNLMDMMKVEKQRNHHSSYPSILSKFSAGGFARANLHGLFPWGVAMYGTRGLVYGACYGGLSYSLKNTPLSEQNKKVIASIGGGLAEGAATTPMSLMRTRTAEAVVGGPAPRMDFSAVKRTLPLSAMKRGGDWGLRSLIYHRLNKDYSHATSAFSAGVISSIITIPIDRMLPLLQQNNPPNRPLKWVVASIKERGMQAAFAGTGMRLLHAGWHTMFIFGALHLLESEKLVKY